MDDYQKLFIETYCRKRVYLTVLDHEPVQVDFRSSIFGHAFYDSSDKQGADDVFSPNRAERMLLIEALLNDPHSERYFGWDKKQKRDAPNRCVLVHNSFDYVVVLDFFKSKSSVNGLRARFVTCYVANSFQTMPKIRSHPTWDFKKLQAYFGV